MINKKAKSLNYKIKVESHLDCCWSEWFSGLKIFHRKDGTTVLCGPIADQTALHSILTKIRDMNLTLISVKRCLPNSEEGSREINSSSDLNRGKNNKSSRELGGGENKNSHLNFIKNKVRKFKGGTKNEI